MVSQYGSPAAMLDRALKKFGREIDKSGVKRDVRRHEHWLTRSQRRRMKRWRNRNKHG